MLFLQVRSGNALGISETIYRVLYLEYHRAPCEHGRLCVSPVSLVGPRGDLAVDVEEIQVRAAKLARLRLEVGFLAAFRARDPLRYAKLAIRISAMWAPHARVKDER